MMSSRRTRLTTSAPWVEVIGADVSRRFGATTEYASTGQPCWLTSDKMPIWSSTRRALGVSPSPHVLSRGKSARSKSRTSTPWRLRKCAVAEPPGPAPTITASCTCTTPSPNAQPDEEDGRSHESRHERRDDDDRVLCVEDDQAAQIQDDLQRSHQVAEVAQLLGQLAAAQHQPGEDPQGQATRAEGQQTAWI